MTWSRRCSKMNSKKNENKDLMKFIIFLILSNRLYSADYALFKSAFLNNNMKHILRNLTFF